MQGQGAMQGHGVHAPGTDAQGGGRLWIDPAHRGLFERHGLTCMDELFALPGAARLNKASLPPWRERVVLELTDDAGHVRRFFVKRFSRPPKAEQRRRVLAGHGGRSTAGVERHWLNTLQADGLPVPEVVAFGEQRSGWREQRSVLVVGDVGGVSLERWAANRSEPAPRSLVRALAELVADFHGKGYVHRDLYLAHVFQVEDVPERRQLVLIDLQRVMHNPWRKRRWQARDLAQLAYSTPETVAGPRERLRFLKTYLGGTSLRSPGVRRLIQRILRKASRIAAHDARQRRRAAARGPLGIS